MDILLLSKEKEEPAFPSPASKDALLVVAAKQRRVEFCVLYDKYFLRVYRYVVRRVGLQQDAEDLTSRVFMEAMESLDNYREQGSFAAWLFSIAHRKVADHYRLTYGKVALEIASSDNLASTQGNPESWTIHDECLHRLAQELQLLTPEKQEILTQRFFAGLKYREIAAVLGKSEAAIKMMVYRALDELRERLLSREEEQDESK